MRTRRSLQIIVGVLSLIVVACLVAAGVCAAIALLFPNMSATINEMYDNVKGDFQGIAQDFGIGSIAYVIPVVAYGLPLILLLLAAILIFLPDKGKDGKYIAADVLALMGIAISMIFTIVFANKLVSVFKHMTTVGLSFDWIVRIATGGVLAIFILFIGLALGLKRKVDDAVEDDAATEVSNEEQPATYETVAPEEVEQQDTQETKTEYMPTDDTTVEDVTKGAYGSGSQLDAEGVEKINKARMLYEMGAITQAEYIKLVNSYLKK